MHWTCSCWNNLNLKEAAAANVVASLGYRASSLYPASDIHPNVFYNVGHHKRDFSDVKCLLGGFRPSSVDKTFMYTTTKRRSNVRTKIPSFVPTSTQNRILKIIVFSVLWTLLLLAHLFGEMNFVSEDCYFQKGSYSLCQFWKITNWFGLKVGNTVFLLIFRKEWCGAEFRAILKDLGNELVFPLEE